MRHAVEHEPPTNRWCDVPARMYPVHVTPSATGVGVLVAVGLGVNDRAPGSGTPGGKGLVRDAMNAPTPAHAANRATHIATLSPRRIGEP